MLGKNKYNNSIGILCYILRKGKTQLYLINKAGVSKNYIFKHFKTFF